MHKAANQTTPDVVPEEKVSPAGFRVMRPRRVMDTRNEPESAAFRDGAKLAQEMIKEIRATLAK